MIKCKMIHAFPDKYKQLYSEMQDGSTIREWINSVERMSNSLIKDCPELMISIFKTRYNVPESWSIYFDGEYHFKKSKGKAEQNILEELRKIGCWNGSEWIVKDKDLGKLIYKEEINKFKGDMLEILSEIFFNCFSSDEGVGIKDYTPIELDSDFGVDAIGKNVNNHDCVVQVKYRKNVENVIKYEDIAKTFTSATLQLQISDVYFHNNTIYLFTTASGVTGSFEKIMEKKVVVINRGVISTKIDNNKTFWNFAHEQIEKSFTKP